MNKRVKALIAGALVVSATMTGLRFSETKVVTASEQGKAKNVIMMIADGLSTEAVTLARHVKGGTLAMDEISTGSVITSWAGGPITDSAPGGTAYSAGMKTSNKYIGTAPDNTPLATILEGAESVGKATGLIATSEITHATPADFSAHINDRSQYNSILRQQINVDMEVVLGGGFNKPSGFKDVSDFGTYYLDRVKEIEGEGFTFVETKEDMKKFDGDKLWGSFASSDLKYDYDRIADEDNIEPSLAEMTDKAIEVLNRDEDGFFLMVEGSKVDWAAHANNTAGIVSDVLAFDEAVREAVEFAKKDGNTVVVVTTDHGNSGITIGSKDYAGSYDKATFADTTDKLKNAKITEERFNALAKDKSDAEIMTLAKENYGFDLTTEELTIVKEKGIREVIARKVGIGYTTGGHTGEEVYLGVYAPTGIEMLEGVVDNTEVNKYMQRVLFGKEILEDLTGKIFIEGQISLEEIEGTTLNVDTSVKHAPKVIIERLGNVIELELYTNNYVINDEARELGSVMPYIKDKFYIPQELIEVIKNLEEKVVLFEDEIDDTTSKDTIIDEADSQFKEQIEAEDSDDEASEEEKLEELEVSEEKDIDVEGKEENQENTTDNEDELEEGNETSEEQKENEVVGGTN